MMSETEEEIREKVTQKIDEVEQAVQSLQILRKTLLQKAYETKQSILSAFINERNSMQSKEVKLLGEVDSLHHSKDDAVVIQLTKLNLVLGCLRNCLQSEHPCGDCLEKYEDLDMMPVTDISSEFTTASEQLKQAVHTSSSTQYSPHPYCPLQVAVTKMEETEDIMQWLVTPTNVDQHHHTPQTVDSCVSKASNDSHVTEWLLEYHTSNQSTRVTTPKTAAEMGSIFTGVRLDDSENWLRSDVDYRQDNHGLFTQTAQQFEMVATQASNDWLLQSDRTLSIHDIVESDSSVSSTNSSSSSSPSSSDGSSYVVIPSSTPSVITSYGNNISCWLNRAPRQPITSSPGLPSPPTVAGSSTHSSMDRSSVSEWLASCKSPREGSVQRNRLVSMTSLASDVLTVHTDRTDTESIATNCSLNCNREWLLNSKPGISAISSINSELDGWLHSAPSQCTRNGGVSAAHDDWLTVRSKKQHSFDFDVQPEEKHDVVAEKSKTSYWLKGNDDNSSDERWLLTKKSDVSDSLSTSKTRLDKDWLMTVNRMMQISRSDNSGWLIDPSTV